MRSLANELGVPVMTIYNYVASKEALNELVVDHALRPVEVPPPEAGSWEERMRQLQRGARRAMHQHPGLSFSRHGSSSREAMRLAEGAMSILHAGGFAPDEASTAFAALFTFMLGQIELDVLSDSMGGGATFEGVTSAADRSRDELFEIGLETVIIAGINLNVGGRIFRGDVARGASRSNDHLAHECQHLAGTLRPHSVRRSGSSTKRRTKRLLWWCRFSAGMSSSK